jgi:hypothetical protein
MPQQQLPKNKPHSPAPFIPVWWLAAAVTTMLLLLGIGWSLIM